MNSMSPIDAEFDDQVFPGNDPPTYLIHLCDERLPSVEQSLTLEQAKQLLNSLQKAIEAAEKHYNP